MKSRILSILSVTALLAASDALAQNTDGTWTKNATGTQNWSDPANWSGGTVADGTGYTAFLSDVINADRVITLDTARTIGNIYAQDSSNNYSLSGANVLTLDVNSGQSILDVFSGRTLSIGTALTVNDGIEKRNAGAVTITGPITLAGSQTWTNNSTGAVTTGNGANLITNGGFDLTVDGTGTTNFGVVSNTAVTLSGSGALIKNGTGRLNVGGNNTGFSGTVAVNGGVMQVHNANEPIGLGNLTLNGGVISWYWGATYTRTLGTTNSQVQILGGESGFAGAGTSGPTINLGTSVMWGAVGEGTATGYFNPSKFVLGDSGTTNVAATTFSSAINLNGATRTIVVPKGLSAAGNRSTISGVISHGTGTAGLIKEGGGMLILSVAPTYNGTTTVSGGFLELAALNLNSMGGGAGVRSISVAAGAAVRRNTLDNAFLQRLVENSNEFSVMTGTTSNNLDFSSSTGANLPNAFLGNWASNGAKAEYSGTLTPASDNYRLGSPSYNSGLLGIRNESVMAGTQGLIIGGGSVELVGPKTFTGTTTIRNGARLGLAAISGGGGVALGLQNSALDTGTPSSTGTIWFERGDATGPITGSVATTSATFGGLTGSRNLISVYSTTTGANNSAATTAANITGFTLNVADGVTHTYSGAIGGFGTGGNSTLTKTGPGTQVLSGASTYAGTTTVSQGTLIIAGSTATTGYIDVAAGATLGGGGAGGNATLADDAVLSPGNADSGDSNLFNLESLTLSGASVYHFEPGVPYNTYYYNPFVFSDTDHVNVNGAVTLDGTLRVANRPHDPTYDLSAVTAGDRWLIMSYSGLLTDNTLDIDPASVALPAGLVYKIDTTQNGYVFLEVAVPEAGTAVLLGVGIVVLRLLRRRGN